MEDLGDILKRLDREPPPATRQPSNTATGDDSNGPCPQCAGRGWYTVDVPVGHPDFGLAVTCDCQEDRIEGEGQARLVRYSNLGQLARFTFDALSAPEDGDRETLGLFEAAREKAAEFAESPTGWLVFVGPHGSGKTRMAAAIANRCIERGHIALFVHVPDLMDHLRSSFGPTSELSKNTGWSSPLRRANMSTILSAGSSLKNCGTADARDVAAKLVNHSILHRVDRGQVLD